MPQQKQHHCSVMGCTKQHKALHTIPVSEELRAQWIDFIYDGDVPARVGKKMLVCANHFTGDCFMNLGQYNTGLAKRLLLVEGAVPTIRCKKTDTVTGFPPRTTRVAMSRRRWSEEDGEFTLGGAREGLRSKPRFSFTELRVLLDAVKKNRYILLKKFNQGVPAEDKKRTWTDITNQINCLGENHRQVRQIMKKWADLKCDGKRRIAAMRGPNGSSVRKKGLGPVEKMVHKILKLSPNRDVDSDSDLEGAELYKRYGRGPAPYLSLTDSPPGGAAFDISPLSSPEKDIGDQLQSSSEVDLAEDGELGLDFEENEDSTFSSLSSSLAPASSSSTPAEPPPPLPDSSLPRSRPVHTYSRTVHNPVSDRPPPPPGPSASSFSSSGFPPDAAAAPPPPLGGAAALAQVALQSLEQQRAGRALLGSVAGSLEALAGSARLLVESQRAFVQEALLLQREALAVLTDFSNATLGVLRDKAAAANASTPR